MYFFYIYYCVISVMILIPKLKIYIEIFSRILTGCTYTRLILSLGPYLIGVKILWFPLEKINRFKKNAEF